MTVKNMDHPFSEDDGEEEVDDEDDGPQVDNSEEAQPKWYSSIGDLMHDVNTMRRKLCKHPVWKISIDEMLRKFKSRSAQASRMKRKPDLEG